MAIKTTTIIEFNDEHFLPKSHTGGNEYCISNDSMEKLIVSTVKLNPVFLAQTEYFIEKTMNENISYDIIYKSKKDGIFFLIHQIIEGEVVYENSGWYEIKKIS